MLALLFFFYSYFVFYVGTLSNTIPRRVERKLLTGDSKTYWSDTG